MPAAGPGGALAPGTYEPFEPAPRRTQGPAAAPPLGPESAYVIQVAAFGEREPADDLAYLLRRRYPDYASRVVPGSGLFHVWLGGWRTREEAASVLLIVRQRHADAWIVVP